MLRNKNITDIKVGVLGGGQLGKMLALAAANWHLPLHFLDRSADFPAGLPGANFSEGSFKNYDDVLNFGRQMDVVTVEIEAVNTPALKQLQSEGVIVHPDPQKLDIIKDKGLQKQFYQQQQLPSSAFTLFEDGRSVKAAIRNGSLSYPFVQKARTAGYDGQGVAVINDENDLPKILPNASVVEQKVDINKELAVVVARNHDGEIRTFPTVEMEFHPVANLVEFLICPASIAQEIDQQAQDLAISVMKAFGISGLLAVELFLDQDNKIWINEVAPRPHNSGHHTIDSCPTSQFEQHLRAILNLPLGDTALNCPAVMINLLGSRVGTGPASYKGLAKSLSVNGANFHLYGKKITKPFRKMGHVTITDQNLERAREKARLVQSSIEISPTGTN